MKSAAILGLLALTQLAPTATAATPHEPSAPRLSTALAPSTPLDRAGRNMLTTATPAICNPTIARGA